MDILQRKIITVDQRTYLKNELNFTPDIITVFIQNRIIDNDDRDALQSQILSKARKCDFFIDCLERSGPDAFDTFCVSVACNKLPWIAARLKTVEASKLLPGKTETERAEVVEKVYISNLLNKCREELRARLAEMEKDLINDFNDIIHYLKSDCSRILPASEPYKEMLDKQAFLLEPKDKKINQLQKNSECAAQCIRKLKDNVKAIKDHLVSKTTWPKTLKTLLSDMIQLCSSLPSLLGFNKLVMTVLTDIQDILMWTEINWIQKSSSMQSEESQTCLDVRDGNTQTKQNTTKIKETQTSCACNCTCYRGISDTNPMQSARDPFFSPIPLPKTPAPYALGTGGEELDMINKYCLERGCTLQSISLLTPEGTFLISSKPGAPQIPQTPMVPNLPQTPVPATPVPLHSHVSGLDINRGSIEEETNLPHMKRSVITRHLPDQRNRTQDNNTHLDSGAIEKRNNRNWRAAAKGAQRSLTFDGQLTRNHDSNNYTRGMTSGLTFINSSKLNNSSPKKSSIPKKQVTRYKTPKAFHLNILDAQDDHQVTRDSSSSPNGLPRIDNGTNNRSNGLNDGGSPDKVMFGSRVRAKPLKKASYLPNVNSSKKDPVYSNRAYNKRRTWRHTDSLPIFKP